ncbi:MAG: Nif11-like leader peptide family natural product precursor [Atopobiaceae bacterium]|nr:Nif11-like leader peptide family natural product precursor [Atopobiaceae bacterium]
MNFEDLTAEQKEKAKACKTPEEVLELAKEEGIELTDEQLESVSGGADWWKCEEYHGHGR